MHWQRKDLNISGQLVNQTLPCKSCQTNSSKIARHMSIHGKEKMHNCVQCQKSFGQAGDLKRHKLIHSGEKPHKCTQCDYATAQIGYLRDHIKTHSTEKPNQCNWCEFSSITKKILPNIFSPTVERRHITVKSAGAHSTEQKLWRGTSAFTLEKSHTSAQNVITQVQNLVVSESICGRNTLLW